MREMQYVYVTYIFSALYKNIHIDVRHHLQFATTQSHHSLLRVALAAIPTIIATIVKP